MPFQLQALETGNCHWSFFLLPTSPPGLLHLERGEYLHRLQCTAEEDVNSMFVHGKYHMKIGYR